MKISFLSRFVLAASLVSPPLALAQVPPSAPQNSDTAERANKAALLQVLLPKNASAPGVAAGRTMPHTPQVTGRNGVLPPSKPSVGRTSGEEEEEGGQVRTTGDEEEIPQARTTGNIGGTPLNNGGTPRAPGGGLLRTTGDEDEMEDLDIQRRTAGDVDGGPGVNPQVLPPGTKIGRPAQTGGTPLENGAAPRVPGGGLSRATGDEDEMEDLDIQRRTAPSDQGNAPLPSLDAPLQKGIATPRTIRPGVKATRPGPTGVDPLGNGAQPRAPGGGLSRTTGDEDEMEDLDIQRRTAPSDQGNAPLPSLDAPLRKGNAGVPAVPPTPQTPSREIQATAPLPKSTRNLPADVAKTVGVAGGSLKTSQAVYREGDTIVVTFSSNSGSTSDWMTIMPVGLAEDNWREWMYLNGEPSGTREFKQKLAPGTYEVRLYHDWPRGKFQVMARTTFTVR